MLKDEKFDTEEIIKLAKSFCASPDPLAYIDDYNKQLSISQVVRFFERQGISITKAMIQNYVRLGLLPPPINKRYYAKEHFMVLVMLIKLKELYPLEVIGKVLAISSDFSENKHISGLYEAYFKMCDEASGNICNSLPDILEGVKIEAEKIDTADSEKHRMSLTLMNIMAQSAVAKQIADSFIEKYTKKL